MLVITRMTLCHITTPSNVTFLLQKSITLEYKKVLYYETMCNDHTADIKMIIETLNQGETTLIYETIVGHPYGNMGFYAKLGRP